MSSRPMLLDCESVQGLAGFDPDCAAELLDRLNEVGGEREKPSWLSTHPHPSCDRRSVRKIRAPIKIRSALPPPPPKPPPP